MQAIKKEGGGGRLYMASGQCYSAKGKKYVDGSLRLRPFKKHTYYAIFKTICNSSVISSH